MLRFIVAWFWRSDIACIGTVVRNADDSLCNFSGAVYAIGLKRSVYHSEAGMRNRRSGAGTKGSTNERQIGEDGANGQLDTGSVAIAHAIHVCKILYLRQFAQKIDECSTWMNQESCPPPFDNEMAAIDRVISLVRAALEISENYEFTFVAIDLSSALDKLWALRSEDRTT